MADISDNNAALTVKIVGADSSGLEQTPVQSTAAGGTHVNLRNVSGTEIATSGNPVRIDPTGTTSQPVTQPLAGIPFVEQQYESYNSNLSKCFCMTTNNPLKGTVESPFVLFTNPGSSGKTIYITRINFSGAGTFRVYFIPTITSNGTAQTVLNKKVVSGAQGNVATVFLNPILLLNGTLGFLSVVTAQAGTYSLDLEAEIIVPQGFSIVVTTAMAANNTITNASFRWMEL